MIHKKSYFLILPFFCFGLLGGKGFDSSSLDLGMPVDSFMNLMHRARYSPDDSLFRVSLTSVSQSFFTQKYEYKKIALFSPPISGSLSVAFLHGLVSVIEWKSTPE